MKLSLRRNKDPLTLDRIHRAKSLMRYLEESTKGNLSSFYNERGEKIRGTTNAKVRVSRDLDWTAKYV